MTTCTGKSGRYRYYTCNNRVNEAPTSRKSWNIPMLVLESIVVDNLEDRIFAPERLEPMVKAILDRARNKVIENAEKVEELRKMPAGQKPRLSGFMRHSPTAPSAIPICSAARWCRSKPSGMKPCA
ncbi:MAG: hypothetical protein ACYCS1_03040 [Gammaproteobacteria bacterium]